MLQQTLLRQLENSSGMKLKLKINDNRSTMLSVRWERHYANVSIHRIFLDAPQNVMQALACYIRRSDKVIDPAIKAYIQDKITTLHYPINDVLKVKGKVYNLKKIYDEVNQEYFDGKLKLSITWFGTEKQPRTKLTLGMYFDPMKLIKINQILDSAEIPHYLISFIMYHEMLHHVCPGFVDKKGINQIHTREFKLHEEQFKYFNEAQNWIKEHQSTLFKEID
jgi:hypothetical protein